jgi:hypothetical protein
MLRNQESTTTSSAIRAETMFTARRKCGVSTTILTLANLEILTTTTNRFSLTTTPTSPQAFDKILLEKQTSPRGRSMDRRRGVNNRRRVQNADLVAGI